MIKYLERIIYSCFSKRFYQESANHTFAERLLTLISAVVIIAILMTAGGIVWLIANQPELSQKFDKYKSELQYNIFPEDLLVTLDEGQLTINKPSPYIMTPESFKKKSDDPELLIYSADANIEDLRDYNTVILVTKTAIATVEKSGEIRMYKFSDLDLKERLIIDHEKFVSTVTLMINQITSYKYHILIFGSVMLLIFGAMLIVFVLMYKLLTLFFYALLGLFVSYITKKNLTYSDCYLNGMYLCIPLTVATWLIPSVFIFIIRIMFFMALFVLLVPIKSNMVSTSSDNFS